MTPSAAPPVELRNPGAVASVPLRVYDAGAAAAPVVVLGHGAGSHIDHPVHVGVCAALAAAGVAVATFNFPYAAAGRRSPDPVARLLDCFRDVVAAVQHHLPGRPLVGGGRSMGGRMASLLAAEGVGFAGLVLLNYPLVASRGGADAPPRTAHWPDIEVPVLFVHGTRDRLFPADVFEEHRGLLRVSTTVHVIDDADHVFAVPRRANRSREDVYAEVAETVATWTSALVVRT